MRKQFQNLPKNMEKEPTQRRDNVSSNYKPANKHHCAAVREVEIITSSSGKETLRITVTFKK